MFNFSKTLELHKYILLIKMKYNLYSITISECDVHNGFKSLGIMITTRTGRLGFGYR